MLQKKGKPKINSLVTIEIVLALTSYWKLMRGGGDEMLKYFNMNCVNCCCSKKIVLVGEGMFFFTEEF